MWPLCSFSSRIRNRYIFSIPLRLPYCRIQSCSLAHESLDQGKDRPSGTRDNGRQTTMRVRLMGCVVLVLAIAMMSQTALACHKCKQNPCVLVAQPAYQCVTELVPYTVLKNQWRTEYETVEKTVMVREPITNYVERQRVVCKPIHETDYVTQTYTVCKPVQTTQQVTSYCMQPTTQIVTVPT